LKEQSPTKVRRKKGNKKLGEYESEGNRRARGIGTEIASKQEKQEECKIGRKEVVGREEV
jgi:hypothetical protein